MDVKVGDRVSIDSFKVGQPRRAGTVKEISDGISGRRLSIEWDDGSRTSILPGAGSLVVEAKRVGKKSSAGKAATSKAKSRSKRR